MEFSITKRAMFIMKSGKRETMERTEQPNQERIRTPGKKENYEVFEILEADKERKKGASETQENF